MREPEAVRAGLDVLATVEREAGLPSRRLALTPYRVGEGHAQRVRARLTFDDVPARAPKEAPRERIRARSRADLVIFGEFDRAGSTRLRAFHGRGRQGPVAIKVQPYHGERRHGIGRELAARRQVAELAPQLAPQLLAHGVVESDGATLGYLVDGLVPGRHPLGSEVHEVVGPLTRGLLELYRAVGIEQRPFSAMASDQLPDGWRRLADDHEDAADLLPRVQRLVARDRTVAVSLAHGDPVASNVVVTDAGDVVLVDWEYARRGPVAGDLAKPLQQAQGREEALAAVERAVGDALAAPEAYTLREQLALAQIRLLDWHESQWEKAAAADRLPQLRRTLDQRLSMIRWMLD